MAIKNKMTIIKSRGCQLHVIYGLLEINKEQLKHKRNVSKNKQKL